MNCRLLIFTFFAVGVILSSCKGKDYPPVTPLTTNLNVINASADTLNYYINGTRQNTVSSIYPGGSTYYLNVITGPQKYSFKKAGSPVVLFDTTLMLDTAMHYSIFIGNPSTGKTFFINDNLSQAAIVANTDTLHKTGVIRFVHAAPGMGQLSVVINKITKVALTKSSFKYVSPFMLVTDTVNEVKVYQNSGLTPIVDTTFTFQRRNIYTLFAKGVLNGSGTSAFSIVLVNTGTVN
jgi:hypothetical protein